LRSFAANLIFPRFPPCACLIPFAILNKPSTDSSLDLG
jgi:hypothetical protein